MDSLEPWQRRGIAEVIKSFDVQGSYGMDQGRSSSVFVPDAEATINSIAYYFETYDPNSVHE
jgi:hypothetical protein